ncbi:MAG: TlyA family RNA methyltransferase [Bacillota bacterium]|jgi:23S rRNA (cytidine1920-2'-O)/16S rRNA (cytidine1409-2'-O)-methyltransferase
MAEKKRLDILLVEKGFFPAREKAKAAIMAGEVLVDGKRVDKAGSATELGAKIQVKSKELPYVSRGGLKLAKALDVFAVDPNGMTVLDIGSSTGGFVDCALQAGAAKVYAVDVGYGQLAWKLRQDERVVVLEKTNARYLTIEDIPEKIDLITVDVSFISLHKVLPSALEFLSPTGLLIALVKPQFEAGKDKVGKKGVIRDRKIHQEVLEKVLKDLLMLKMQSLNLDFSPITGAEGNIEYLLLAQKINEESSLSYIYAEMMERLKISEIIDKSWSTHR